MKKHRTSDDTCRAVWCAVSSNPRSSLRELADATGLHYSTVRYALHQLQERGLIDRQPGRSRTIVVKAARHQDAAYTAIWFDIT